MFALPPARNDGPVSMDDTEGDVADTVEDTDEVEEKQQQQQISYVSRTDVHVAGVLHGVRIPIPFSSSLFRCRSISLNDEGFGEGFSKTPSQLYIAEMASDERMLKACAEVTASFPSPGVPVSA